MACPVPTKDFLQLGPEADIAPFGCIHPLPLSAGTDPKSQGHCWKWHHKLKVVWCIYASIT